MFYSAPKKNQNSTILTLDKFRILVEKLFIPFRRGLYNNDLACCVKKMRIPKVLSSGGRNNE